MAGNVDGGFDAMFIADIAATGLVGAKPAFGFGNRAHFAPHAGSGIGPCREGPAIGQAAVGDALPCSTGLSTGDAD